MRLSRKTDYALRTMVDLAQQNGGLTPVGEIAARQGISTNFLEQILLTLKGGDLVASRRGKKGGYFLARQPEKITLADIVHLTEGAVGLSNCVHNPELCIGGKKGACAIRPAYPVTMTPNGA